MQIERETLIAAPVERVWAVLTEGEHVGRWFSDAGAEIDLQPGGEMVLRWAEYGIGRARVVDVEPPRRFSYRWAAIRCGHRCDVVPTRPTSSPAAWAPWVC